MGLYLLGIAAALVSSVILKSLIKRRETSFLVIELPEYKPPNFKNVTLDVYERIKTFIVEAGKIIMIISIILWVLASYGPAKQMKLAESKARTEAVEKNYNEIQTDDLIAAHKIEASFAGNLGKWIEPAIKPLGFDWKIGIALITSFAAREIFVGTMATIYSIGSSGDSKRIREHMALEINKETGKPVYTFATSFSLLIFYVFAMQCMSTLAIVRRETKTWRWPFIQFLYMSLLAYLSSLIIYQILS